MPILWLAAASVARAVECAGPIAVPELADAVDAAERSYAAMDMDAFRDEANTASGVLLPCLAQVIPTELAARYERVMALHFLAIGDADGARAAIEAARTAAAQEDIGQFPLPASLAEAWSHAPTAPPVRKVPEPRAGSLAFDGDVTRLRIRGQPAVVQVLDGSGTPVETLYVRADAPLPQYDAVARHRTALIAVSAGALGVSLITGIGSSLSRGDLYAAVQDPTTPADALDAARDRTNALGATALVTLGIGFGAGVTAVAVGDR